MRWRLNRENIVLLAMMSGMASYSTQPKMLATTPWRGGWDKLPW